MAGHISASVRYGAMLRFSSALPLCTVWWESALTGSSLSSFLFGIEPVCLFKICLESFFRYSYSSGMHVTILIMFAWVMALVISLPMHITYPGFSSWYSSYACSPMDDLDSAGYRIFSAILEFIVPAILVIVLNFAIVVKIRIRSQLKISRIQQMVLLIFFGYT